MRTMLLIEPVSGKTPAGVLSSGWLAGAMIS